MTPPQDDRARIIKLQIQVSSSQPELLTGLEAWLNLGLISDREIKRIARSRLSCQIREPVITQHLEPPPEPSPSPALPPAPVPTTEERVESLLSRAWHSFLEELSVRWLLFLGIFAVLVASGGLAASQWETFPAVAQYGVLWAYTLAFGGVGAWLAQQPQSSLTAGALQTIAALLVPVNFWAMDALIPWQSPVGWLTVALAAGTLSLWTLLQTQQRLLIALTFLGVSYLHWGWGIDILPMIAVHLGAIATTTIAVIFSRRQEASGGFLLSETSLMIYGLVILLGRGILVVGIPFTALDLAIAVCGWLLTLDHEDSASPVSKAREVIGAGLLFAGWLLALEESYPWQAVVASALALEFFWRRVRQSQLRRDLMAVFFIGLQGWWLLWRLIPETARFPVVSFSEGWLDIESAFFLILLSVGLFPYLLLFLVAVEWLDRNDYKPLAGFGERLALFTGSVFTLLTLESPGARSLNLLLGAIALIWVSLRRSPTRKFGVYLTRVVIWFAIASGLDWGLPNLSVEGWGVFGLAAMIGEWTISARVRPVSSPSPLQVASRGGWYLGFGFAGLSFLLLAESSADPIWRVLWLLAPLTLTIITPLWEEQRRSTAAGWGIATSLIAQGLTITAFSSRILGWGIATILIGVNARYFPKTAVAMLPVGSALALLSSPFWNCFELAQWCVWGAIALLMLGIAADRLGRRRGKYAEVYTRACNYWGIMVCVVLLTTVALHSMGVYRQLWESVWLYPLATSLCTIPLGWRYWENPTEATVYGGLIAIELTAAETVVLLGGSLVQLAMVNLVLGFLTLALTRSQTRTSFQIAPLCFAGVGIATRLASFTPYTGGLTLGAAVIALFVGARRQQWRQISYWGLLGVFFACQELALYPFRQINPPTSDIFSLFASVSLALALAYQGGLWLLRRQQRESILGLRLGELTVNAHLHWGIAGVLETLAATATSDRMIAGWGLPVSLVFATYALVQGYNTRNEAKVANVWLFWGWLGGELALIEIIPLVQGNGFTLALIHISLALVMLAVTEWWRRRSNNRLVMVELSPVLLASVGIIARLEEFTAYTGALVIAAAIAALGVGARREDWRFLSYFALFGVSFGSYELLLYQMLQGEGGSLADGLTLLAAVPAVIALVERSLVAYMRSRAQETCWGVPLPTLKTTAHLHWALGSLLKIAAIAFATASNAPLTPLGVGVSLTLAGYAVLQGRDRSAQSDWWIYVGLVQLIGVTVYFRLVWQELAVLDPWTAAIACLVGLGILQLPLGRWGWNVTPWYRIAIALPAVRVTATATTVEWLNLFLVAAFYGRIAWRERSVRWSYLSMGLTAWAIARLIQEFQLDNPFWFSLLIGLPILYVATVDPALRHPQNRANRHWLRLFGSSIIGVASFFHYPEIGLTPTVIGLIFVFGGIALQVRAFLFVGTVALILTGIDQAIAFSQTYAFAKWAITLILGLILIAIAASFESRRDQITATLQNWRTRLREWE